MEGQPPQHSSLLAEYGSTEREPTDKESKKSSKKKKETGAKDIGTFMFESNPNSIEHAESEPEERNLWQRFVGSEKEKAKSGTPEHARGAAVEAHNVHGGLRPESIGQVLLTAESQANPAVERAKAIAIDKHAETLSRADLLELSGKIVIDGHSLRQSYENHMIGEKALRRLIAEHLRGGDIRKALRLELVQHEIDFERDPMMRDRAHQAAGDTSHTALNDLLQRANNSSGPNSDEEEREVLRARADFQAKEQDTQAQRRRTIDIALYGTITVLLGLVIFLVISHK